MPKKSDKLGTGSSVVIGAGLLVAALIMSKGVPEGSGGGGGGGGFGDEESKKEMAVADMLDPAGESRIFMDAPNTDPFVPAPKKTPQPGMFDRIYTGGSGPKGSYFTTPYAQNLQKQLSEGTARSTFVAAQEPGYSKKVANRNQLFNSVLRTPTQSDYQALAKKNVLTKGYSF